MIRAPEEERKEREGLMASAKALAGYVWISCTYRNYPLCAQKPLFCVCVMIASLGKNRHFPHKPC